MIRWMAGVAGSLLLSCAGGDAATDAAPAPKPEVAQACTWEVLAFDNMDHTEIVAGLTAELDGASGIDRWAEENGRKPSVRFRTFKNQTPETIDLKAIATSVQKSMAESGRVALLADAGAELAATHEEQDEAGGTLGEARGADLVGILSILSFDDATATERSRMYRVDMELVSATTGDKIWIGSHQIQKMCELPQPEEEDEE